MTVHRALRMAALASLASLAILIGLIGTGAQTIAAPITLARTSTYWANNLETANPWFVPDVDGEMLDAHSPSFVPVKTIVNDVIRTTYYMYGDSYNCGWTWGHSSATERPWCGINIYSSTDLSHWKKLGPAITDLNALQSQFGGQSWKTICAAGCFRPKVAYNKATKKYVLWFNVANKQKSNSGFAVLTSDSPAGPFTNSVSPQLVAKTADESNGDHEIFVDTDGTAWLSYTRIEADNNHWIIIERLNSTYTGKDLVNPFHSALKMMADQSNFPSAGVEAPVVFKFMNTYYLMFSETCPYCQGTNTWYTKAPNLTGTWEKINFLHTNSCYGQPDTVIPLDDLDPSPNVDFLYVSDQWQGGKVGDHSVPGSGNQALAPFYMGPLNIGTDGIIPPITCENHGSFTSIDGSPGANTSLPPGWQGTKLGQGFRNGCDIRQGTSVMQTFTPKTSGILNTIKISAYQRYVGTLGSVPDQPLEVSIWRMRSPNDPPPLTRLQTRAVLPSEVKWAPSWVTVGGININVTPADVASGQQFGVELSSRTTTGCYGVAASNLYNDSTLPDAFPGGKVHVFTNNTWRIFPYQDYNFRSNL